MWRIWANLLLPKALKSGTKSNKSPNLVTLGAAHLLFQTLGSTSMTNLEIRIGNEVPTLDNPRYLNSYCGTIRKPFDLDNVNNTAFNFTIASMTFVNVSVNCSRDMFAGRYITIQKLECSRLEIYEVTFLPNPGKIDGSICPHLNFTLLISM